MDARSLDTTRNDSRQYTAGVRRDPIVTRAPSMVVPPRLSDPLVMSYLATSNAVSTPDKGQSGSMSPGAVGPGAYVKTGKKMYRLVVRERIVEWC